MAYIGCTGIAPRNLNPVTRRRWEGQLRTPVALPQGNNPGTNRTGDWTSLRAGSLMPTALRQILHWTTNFKKMFVSVMNILLIYLFASMKLEKVHKNNYLALVLKLCYIMIFYEIGRYIIRNGGLNKKLITIHWKRMCLVDLFCLVIIFTT